MTSESSSAPGVPTSVTAIAAVQGGAATDASFRPVQVELGEPGPHDLLVEVRARSVNPVDVKQRGALEPGDQKVLGYDAAGVVVAAGPQVTRFAVGDEVWYAGSIARDGSNATHQLVDERITGHKPA